MSKRTVHLVLKGRVQGVGFRYFALYKADELRISGWARNTPEGNVEIEAEGESPNLDLFIDWMKSGPTRAIVQSFSVSEIAPFRDFKNFTIR